MLERIGLFGGTFDPPHLGHLILASEAAQQLNLTRVLWMLAPDPPHKLDQLITPLAHRLEMLRRATVGNRLFEISYIEINRPGPHYTIETVKRLADQNRGAQIILLIGGDSLRDLPKWREPDALVAAVDCIGVMPRPTDPVDMDALAAQIPHLREKVQFLDVMLQELSSSELRERIASGKTYRYYLPAGVYEYIEAQRLYQRGEGQL